MVSRSTLTLSLSAPTIPTMTRPRCGGTLTQRRGLHDSGMLKDMPLDADVYVPRALWTEATESPMKVSNRTVEWDPRQFLEEERRRAGGKERLRNYLVGQYTQQWNETQKKHDTLIANSHAEARAMNDDLRAYEAEEDNKRKMASTANDARNAQLAAANRLAAQRMRNARMQEARELAEVKLRVHAQLDEEHRGEQRKRAEAKKNADMLRAQVEANKQRRLEERQQEAAEQRQLLRDTNLQDEYRLMAQQSRMQAGREAMERGLEQWQRAAGKMDDDRRRQQEEQLRRDELRNNLKQDKYIAARNQARERMRLQMCEELATQTTAAEKRRLIDSQMRRQEADGVRAVCEEGARRDAERLAQKKAEEAKVQREQKAMMADRQEREKRECYKRPPAANTMAVLAATEGRQDARDLRRERRAAKAAATAPARAETKPWVNISKSQGFDRVGTFAGEGGSAIISLKATGGTSRILT
eukprot:TRINITY_DN31901_c0_g1_i1.p1 TRINITY_DN31901_c0_g1~~TRINITY_DN31901_c0_g1_i1.p1  ORF type:complete len:472 (-),score=122.27 TRINITY_DN31901_c0_g1_i1:183-1598(-)